MTHGGARVKSEVGDKAVQVTRSDVTVALRRVGIVSGDTVMFHSSLSSMGTVIGGADPVIDGAAPQGRGVARPCGGRGQTRR